MPAWKTTMAAVAGAAVAGAAFAALTASAGAAGAKTLYSGILYGNIPNITVRGVAAGIAPWIVKGSASVSATGIVAKGTDLVVPPGYMDTGKPVAKSLVGTTVGITAIGAELTCGQGTSLVTATAPLSTSGAFDLKASVKVPSTCSDPILLIGEVAQGKMVAWFASTDFLTYGLRGNSDLGWTSITGGKSGSTSSWSG